MYPVLLQLGPIKLHSYGLMLAIAFLVCGHLYSRELARRGLDPDLASTVMTWALIGGLVGARLYYLIEFWDDVKGNLLKAAFSGAGLVIYGGLLGGFALSYWMVKRRGAPALEAADAVAPLLALGYAIGRIGCLLAGDGDYGPPTSLPWGMSFPNGVVPTIERVHPTPLYETLMMTGVFAILWRLRTRPWPRGRMLALYLVLQAIERFVAEQWRINPTWVGGLSGARIWALVTFAIGAVWLLRLRNRRGYGDQAGNSAPDRPPSHA